MPKYRIVTRPTGLLNAQPWPEVGETIDLPAAVGDGMPELEPAAGAKVETRPAVNPKAETRAAKKSASKKA